MHHALIVGPNAGNGLDSRCLMDGLAFREGHYKGVEVVHNDTARERLQRRGAIRAVMNVGVIGTRSHRDAALTAHEVTLSCAALQDPGMLGASDESATGKRKHVV